MSDDTGYPWYWRVTRALPPGVRTAARRSVDALAASAVGSVARGTADDVACLTLDDGPEPSVTPGVLDVLAEAGARCTFFLLAARATAHPELTRRIAAAGHEIALHGRDHRPVSGMSAGEAARYLRDARAELEDVVQRPVTMFRPPYGAQSLGSYLGARRAGLDVVVWSTDAADWVDRPRPEVVRDALSGLLPGGVLLFHERLEPHPTRGAPETSFDRVAAVAEIVAGMRERGLTPAPVGELPGQVRTAWFRP